MDCLMPQLALSSSQSMVHALVHKALLQAFCEINVRLPS